MIKRCLNCGQEFLSRVRPHAKNRKFCCGTCYLNYKFKNKEEVKK